MSALGEAPRVPMPKGLHNVYIYEIFNATSWIVILGSPMLLFFQRLHASATVLAIAAGLAPVMTLLQVPAAPYVEKIGYRRFVVNGWTARSLFIIAMAVVAFLPDEGVQITLPAFLAHTGFGPDLTLALTHLQLARTTRIVVMLLLALGYNIMRGIATCGLLPWFTHIVPESRRGEFLAKDQLAASVAVIAALAGFSWILNGGTRWYSFGLVYAISAASAFVSVRFLRRVPDVAVEKIVRNPNPLPWKQMFLYPPFQRYIRYNVVINLALGASGVFWVRFFRETLRVSDSNILLVASGTTSVLALGLYLVSQIIDRTGNRPALTLSGGMYACHFTIWACVAAGIIPVTMELIVFQCVISGLAGALWNLANLRAVIGIVPVMGRAHFLALYSVAANLTVALIPLLWGSVIDGMERWQAPWGWWHWNSFSIFYLVLALTMVGGLGMLRGVQEPEAMDWDEFTRELLVNTPSRAIGRVISRFRGPGL
jgi:MFS family permease